MARLSFRDRFFTPPVARAMTSPAGILAAGAGVSAGVLLALPVAGVAALGAAAWAARVALAVPRDPRAQRIDPFTLQDPWRRYTQEAIGAQQRFTAAVRQAPGGPLRDRLASIGQRLDDGVQECWRIARHAQALSDARRQIDVARITAELQQVGDQAREPWAAGSALARTAEALDAQLATATRMDTTLADAEARLRLLDARMDETVTRAIELSVQAHDLEDLAGLQGDVDGMVQDMEALRLALDEAEGAGRAGPLSGRLPGAPGQHGEAAGQHGEAGAGDQPRAQPG